MKVTGLQNWMQPQVDITFDVWYIFYSNKYSLPSQSTQAWFYHSSQKNKHFITNNFIKIMIRLYIFVSFYLSM
jgi:hypothetical protein